jgi:tetratricopeptide (TPR) repeat protein
VCAFGGVGREDVLDLVTGHVDRSLAAAEPVGRRFTLLETMREYAREKLGPEAASLAERHFRWFSTFVERLVRDRFTGKYVGWIDALRSELGNCRSAFTWSLEHSPEEGLRMAAALETTWLLAGALAEGRRWLMSFLEAAPGADPAVVGNAFRVAGRLARELGDHDEARALCERGLEIARGTGDAASIARALYHLGDSLLHAGDVAHARPLLDEALAMQRRGGSDAHAANDLRWTLFSLGEAALAVGDPAAARSLFEEALTYARTFGDSHDVAMITHGLGRVEQRAGAVAAASDLFEEALRAQRELKDRNCAGDTLASLGRLRLEQGSLGPAADAFLESLSLRSQLLQHTGVLECLDGLARVEAARGDAERAAALERASASVREGALTLEDAVAVAAGRRA